MKVLITTIALFYVASLSAQLNPQNTAAETVQESVMTNGVQGGTIDWENHTLTAFGMGRYPQDAVHFAQAKARAKRAALDVVQRNIWLVVESLRLDGETTLGQMMDREPRIKQRVARWIHEKATVTMDTENADGFRVTVTLSMTEQNSLYAGLLPMLLNPR